MKQVSSVEAHVQEYERAAAQLSTMLEEQRLGYFMNGLRDEIKRQTHIHESEDLNRAMQLAMDIEDKITEIYKENYSAQPLALSVGGYKAGFSLDGFEPEKQKKDFRLGHTSYPRGPKRAQTAVSTRLNLESGGSGPGCSFPTNHSQARSSAASSNRGILQLPYVEFLKQEEEGRCFRCGLKFGPLQECPQWQLQVLIMAEEPNPKGEGEFIMVENEKKRI